MKTVLTYDEPRKAGDKKGTNKDAVLRACQFVVETTAVVDQEALLAEGAEGPEAKRWVGGVSDMLVSMSPEELLFLAQDIAALAHVCETITTVVAAFAVLRLRLGDGAGEAIKEARGKMYPSS
jgi:hypothetical protein